MTPTTESDRNEVTNDVEALEFSSLVLDDALDPSAKVLFVGVQEDRVRTM